MGNLSPLSYDKQPKEFLASLEKTTICGLPSPTEFTLESQYRVAEIGEGFKDLSFMVLNGSESLTVILAHKINDKIGFYASGVEIYGELTNKKVVTFILNHLIEQAKEHDCSALTVDDWNSHKTLSVIGQESFNRKGTPQTRLQVLQNLQQSEEEIHKQLRQSYKALVNQGNREIQFSYITNDTVSRSKFNEFQAFHKQVSGRQTRSIQSWDIQFEMIQKGTAELIMGYLEPYGLVSSGLFNDYGLTTSYAVGVYNRDLFDKPLAHANVYQGLIRAKDRGQTRFNLGIVPSYSAEQEKEYNIGKFKKGFSKGLSYFIEWSIPIS